MNKKLMFPGLVAALLAAGLLAALFYDMTSRGKPPEPLSAEIDIQVPLSTFNLPVTYDIEKLADYLNAKLSGTFLEKTVRPRKSKKEEIFLKLTKNGRITVSSSGEELLCTLPIAVDATLEKTWFAGLFKPVHTSLVLSLATPVSLDRDWNIRTAFRITGYRWVDEPILRLGPLKIHLTDTVNEVIEEKTAGLTAMLDREIRGEVSLKPTMSGVWRDLQKPISISRKPTPVWARFVCEDIRGIVRVDSAEISCHTTLKAKTLVVTDSAAAEEEKPLPPFRTVPGNERSKESDIYLYAAVPFDELNEKLNEEFANKTYSAGGRNLEVRNIRAYASAKGLIMEVVTDETFKSRFYLSGELAFEPRREILKVKNFDYEVSSRNIFVKAGDDILHDRIRDEVAAKLTVDLTPRIDEVPNIIEHAISRKKAGESIALEIENLHIRNCDIITDSKRIHLVMRIATDASITLKRIKIGKPVRIR
ncbi:hypothetical protein CHL67_05760 [Prosthecochloris sp. GSB1]|uniref:DUF4403 family protein n=1 Tax=Prosthecochloris sp. GSB1 TaxID=281093 RepID=UPI000B8C9DCD|nr:DUF4403 family protein [Prosthecochloris sp. GSB1]ASQ90494.1 hypothetical protein CHL67_05760 [Prosthecochloris sp. GSB1]